MKKDKVAFDPSLVKPVSDSANRNPKQPKSFEELVNELNTAQQQQSNNTDTKSRKFELNISLNKVILICISIIVIAIVTWLIIAHSYKIGIFFHNITNSGTSTVTITKTDDGHIYTKSEDLWLPNKADDVIYLPVVDKLETQSVYLLADGTQYFKISIPATEYEYTNFSTIRATDGSYELHVMHEMNEDIHYADSSMGSDYCSYTSETVEGTKTITYRNANGNGIIAIIYSGNDIAGLFKNQLTSFDRNGPIVNLSIDAYQQYRTDNKPTYSGQFVPSCENLDTPSMITNTWYFNDGYLMSVVNNYNLQEVEYSYLVRMYIITGTAKLDKYYSTKNVFYVESGDYTLLLVKISETAVNTYLGKGEEARCNIISLL